MSRGAWYTGVLSAGAVCFIALAALPVQVGAHCDTLDGPVVREAKAALDKGDVTPLLKWVKQDNEEEVRAAFKKTISVRARGSEAKDLADRYFLETLVRIHRAGEGAPYTGLKPAGVQDPAVVSADKALENGSPDELIAMIVKEAREGMRTRFTRALDRKKHAGESVEAGREFVESYVELIHYVERLSHDASHGAAPHGEPDVKGEEGHHQH
ncbi:MAG: DUF6448 family protein [Candidatus Aureabacteria bacterium]|nr:DUF6448 family protein [Candidatus Auribacterota bacterium]